MDAQLFSHDALGVSRASEQARVDPDPPAQPLPRRAVANAEEVIADRTLATHESVRQELLDQLRQRMVVLYQQRLDAQGRELAYVTADDARLILDTDPKVPGPDELNRNFLGALFKAPGWQPTGQYIKSRTAGSHANRLLCWRWVGAQ